MSRLAFPLAALAISYVILFGYVIASFDALPPQVASHFDALGHANGWMSRSACVEFTIGLGVLMPGFIIGLMAGAGRIPVSFINLPHREYWLSSERRKEALEILFRYSLWFASLTVLFVTGLQWNLVAANRSGGEPRLNNVGMILVAGGYLASSTVWIILLVRRFTRLR